MIFNLLEPNNLFVQGSLTINSIGCDTHIGHILNKCPYISPNGDSLTRCAKHIGHVLTCSINIFWVLTKFLN